jgi:hypothetical protein
VLGVLFEAAGLDIVLTVVFGSPRPAEGVRT